MKSVILTLSLVLFISPNLFAHGDGKPGPHGGKIEMPGAYHTEVVAKADGFQIYLLDVSFKNPTVKDSQVKAHIIGGGVVKKLDCKPQRSFYFCAVDKMPTRGELVITSVRENVKGSEAKYTLPIKFD